MGTTLMDMETRNPQTTSSPLDSKSWESDETLAVRFQTENDPSAMEELMRRHKNMAYRTALACTRNADLAEEAAQEAWMSFAQKRNLFIAQGVSSFCGWLYRIVCNQAKMILRREAGERRRALSRRYRDRAAESIAIRQTESVRVFDVEEAETSKVLNEALLSLREEIRMPVALQFVEGMRQEEIAKILGVSQRMVQKRVALGLDLLRKRLAKNGITAGAAALPMLFANATPTIAPATLVEFLKQLASDPSAFAPAAAVSQSVRAASFWSSHKTFFSLLAFVLCATAGGLYAFWPATTKKEKSAKLTVPEMAQTDQNVLWHFDFNHGKPTELRYIEGNWEHRPTGGTDDSGALWALPGENDQPAVFALPENCPPNVIVSYDLIRGEYERCSHNWTWALEPVGRPEKFAPDRRFKLSAENVLTDGRRHHVNVHFSLNTGLIFVSVSDKPLYLQLYNRRTIEAIKHFAPAFVVGEGLIIDNLSVRFATTIDETRLEALWTKVQNFDVETYDYFCGITSSDSYVGYSVHIREQSHEVFTLGGKPEKDLPAQFNFARGFKPTRSGNFETLCFWPNSAPESHLLRFDYFPENAKAAESAGLFCYYLADKHSEANAKIADENFRSRGSPLKSLALHAADAISSLEVGQWHELEFYLTKDLVVCLANGRPWFAAKDPRAIAQPEGIALFFGGHCRLDNLRGREFNPKDEARLAALKKNISPSGGNPQKK
jgi:RNA polymerase sigma-70 factor (ECF subfamily)